MEKDELDYQKALDENQKIHITEFIDKLKLTRLKDIKQYKSVKYYDTTFNDINGGYCKENLFSVIGDVLYTYTARSVYHMRLLDIKETDNQIDLTILIGDFYWGSMTSSNSVITIKL